MGDHSRVARPRSTFGAGIHAERETRYTDPPRSRRRGDALSHLNHGIVGDGRVLALVAPDSGVEWLCLPRFDSPSVFGALLDPAAGTFRVEGRPVGQRYLTHTSILTTELETDAGLVTVTDAAWDGYFLRRVSGPGRVRVVFDPRPDYGRAEGPPVRTATGLRAGDCWLHTDCAEALLTGEIDASTPRTFVLGREAPADFTALFRAAYRAHPEDAALHARDALLHRARQVLRLHTYEPTGAIIAAATTSVPEAIGEPRNWDYRFAWIRDGAFAAEARLKLGETRPGVRFLRFLRDAIGADAPQPLYGIDGRRDLPESTLDHLRGFADTGPVRIGNAAAQQVQNDSYGQIIWLAARLIGAGEPLDEHRDWLVGLAERALAVGDAPDCGIWEFRDRPGRYTFSQLWRWVAFDRMHQIQPEARWRAAADAVRGELLAAADRVGFFAQTLDCANVDASSLMVASLGLVPADDPRFVRTVERCEAVLLVDGLMRRYVAEDDFGHTTSTFGLCTLWWIEALALMGRRTEAATALAAFALLGNPLGLFSEDIEPGSNRMLGNFPQVYSHTGLINARLALG